MSYYGIHHYDVKHWSHGAKKPVASPVKFTSVPWSVEELLILRASIIGFVTVAVGFLIKGLL